MRLIFICCLFFFQNLLYSQVVTNGSVTGAPVGNNVLSNAVGWSGCGFSPDLCDVSFPSYSGMSNVAVSASPDGGSWLGMASLGECAQTTITGLVIGQDYTLCFYGACFGTGASVFYGGPANPNICVGATCQSFTIPQLANVWNVYSMTFTATAIIENLVITLPATASYSSASSSYASLDGFFVNPGITPCFETVCAFGDTICSGNQALLYASCGTVYNWTESGSTLSLGTNDTLLISPTTTTEYVVSIDGANDTVEVFVFENETITIDTSICQGESLLINGVSYSTNQINTLDTVFYTISGCDSIHFDITLQIDTFRTEVIDTTLCSGDVLVVNGETYSTNQINTLDTAFYTLSGCDSVLYDITLQIDTFRTEVIDTSINIGNALVVNGVSYSTNQTNTLDTAFYTVNGCDSVLYDITLFVDTFRMKIIDTAICYGEVLVVNGETYSTNQMNTLDTVSYMISGFDSMYYDITLQIDTFRIEVIDTTLCIGDVLVVNGETYSTNQTNTLDTLAYTISGCDSVHYDITLHIDTFKTEVIDTTLCIGDVITVNGVNYSTNQTNTLDTLPYTISGCDSILYDITIHIDTFRTEIIDTTICLGDILVVNGVNYSTNQTNTLDTLPYTISGCDSILYDITIHIDTFRTEVIDTTICLGDILVVNGVNYSTNQTNTLDTLPYTISDCDSILYDITIHIDTFRTEIIDTTICLGDILVVNGINYSTNQTNTLDTLPYTISGCDSVLYDITIHVDSFIIEVIDTAICIGDVLVVNGKNYSTTQVNTLDTASYFVSGCDSVLYDITLKINQLGVVGVIPDTIAVCDDLSTEITMTASNISTYQWMVNSGAGFLNVLDSGAYFGAQTNELSINLIDIGMNGDLFRLSMYDECGFGPFVDETYLRVTLPHDVINPIPDITQCLRDSSLVFVDYNGSNYIWSDGQAGQYFIPNNPGVFTVDFIENVTNCSMEDEIEIFLNDCVYDCVVSLPTGFSPNNTIGKNDVFSVLTNCVNGFKTYELSIFDRWGERVFFTNNPLQGWDGTYKGTNLEIGTYVYNLDFVKDGGSEKETKSGTITLIR